MNNKDRMPIKQCTKIILPLIYCNNYVQYCGFTIIEPHVSSVLSLFTRALTGVKSDYRMTDKSFAFQIVGLAVCDSNCVLHTHLGVSCTYTRII